MKRHKWDANPKATIVLQGLKGRSVEELCTECQINQSQSYQWRDQFLAHAGQAFEAHQQSQRETRLQQDHAKLKQLVGELTLELKKTMRSGNETVGVFHRGRAEYGHSVADQGAESRLSLLGLPARVGASPLHRRAGRE